MFATVQIEGATGGHHELLLSHSDFTHWISAATSGKNQAEGVARRKSFESQSHFGRV
jgi:hypothetical protein